MKKLFTKSFLLFLLIGLSFSSCKKDSAEEISGTGGTVKAGNYGFDGSASLGSFTSTKAGIVQVSAAGIGTFTITAIKDGNNHTITMVLLKTVTAVGAFKIGANYTNGGITISKDYTQPSDRSLNYSTDNSSTNGNKGVGEINITKLEGKNVEGTFYAIAYNGQGKEAFVEQGTFSGTIK